MDFLENAWFFILAGGPVMWPLLAVSLWLWTLIMAKSLWLWRTGREHIDLVLATQCLLGKASPPPPETGPMAGALEYFMAQPGRGGKADLSLWEMSVRHQAPRLWRHMDAILILAAAAPLLGLLGTVTGMIDTFEVIGIFGTGNAQAMAGGISEALITTQTGLMVAIPGVLAGWALRRGVRKQINRLLSFQRAVASWLESREAF